MLNRNTLVAQGFNYCFCLDSFKDLPQIDGDVADDITANSTRKRLLKSKKRRPSITERARKRQVHRERIFCWNYEKTRTSLRPEDGSSGV
nr:unnamed protein product [Haemonchus contortus]